MARLSGLQRDVLSLYRQCLREVRKKPIDSQSNFKNYARAEFQKHRSVNKKDFSTIEYLLRKGQRQLEMFLLRGSLPLVFDYHGPWDRPILPDTR